MHLVVAMSFSAPFCFDSFNRLNNEKKKTILLHKWFTSCCENVIRDKNKVFFLGDDIKCRHGKSTEQTLMGGRNGKVRLVSVSRLVLDILLEKILKEFID